MIKPFKVSVPESELIDLKERISNTRWPDEIVNSGWKYGTNLSYLKELSYYWESQFEWRKIEQKINAYPNFTATINQFNIHFVHVKSQNKNAVPLLITHGWPGSFLEMFKLIDALTAMNFDVVVPSIPGFGFSEKITTPGVDYGFVADLWHQLMTGLGYDRYGVQGGDIGAGISIRLCQKHPASIIGLHLNYISDSYQPYLKPDEKLDDEVLAYKSLANEWEAKEAAYALVQSTKPLSLAYGLNDSPVGLGGWIIEKFNSWSDHAGNLEDILTKEELLANVTLYWLTQTIHSSSRMYYEIRLNPLIFSESDYVDIPVGYANFPKEIPTPPRSYIEKGLNIIHWSELPKGGHFAALEQPVLLANDIKSFFEKA